MFDASFFLNLFVVHPLVKSFFTKSKLSMPLRIAVAMTFLTVVGVSFVAFESWDSWGHNYFEILGVPRDASLADVKRAYKVRALELHPDRNPEAVDGDAQFIELKDAYNTLINAERREVYDKWGASGLEWLEKESGNGVMVTGIVQACVYYVTWGALVFIMTMSSSETNSRSWAYSGLGLVCACDFGMRFGDLDVPTPMFTSTALHQKVFILQQLYPSFMHACIVIQGVMYVDLERMNLELLKAVMRQNNTLLLRLQSLEAEMRSNKLIKGVAGTAGATVAAAAASAAPKQQAHSKQSASASKHSKSKPASSDEQQEDDGDDSAAAATRKAQAAARATDVRSEMSATPPPPPPQANKIPGWAYMIGIYVLFNYVLK
jgi:hypothetical protein